MSDLILDEGLYTSLNFLKECTNSELDPLVKILTDDPNSDLLISNVYKEHKPNHQKYINKIIDDYETYGGNTIANIFRGNGVGYKEILDDICNKMKVNVVKGASLGVMELALATKITEDAIDKMTPEERMEFAKGIDPKMTNFTKHAVTIAARMAIKEAGFVAYQLLTSLIYTIGTTVLGKTVPWVVYQTSTKWLGTFAGPVGLAVMGAWTVVDIAGPAYRITTPATIYISALRQAKLYEHSHKECNKCGVFNSNSAKFCLECGTSLS